jgi:regulatory protein
LKPPTHDRRPKPLDPEVLERLALRYVSRYATTQRRLSDYLARKVKERGWTGDQPANFERLVARFVAAGYIDDKAFAEARAGAFQRKGLGERRLLQRLRVDGIAEDDCGEAIAMARDGEWIAALRFAKRKRLGPFAEQEPDRDVQRKQMAMLMRAGHSMTVARRVLDASKEDISDEEEMR